MSHLMIYSIGVLMFVGLYLLLSRMFWKVIIGSVFLSHAINLILLSSSGYFGDASPPLISSANGSYVDPLPQALILTAIVISFGITAFILIVLRQVYKKTGTTDLAELEDEEWRGGDNHD